MVKKRLFTNVITVLLLIALLLPIISTRAYALDLEGKSITGIVTASNLNFRKEASLESDIITMLPQGTTVTITAETDGWFKVKYEGKVGYLSSDYVIPLLSKGITTATGLNVRSKPSTSSKAIDYLHRGTKVYILEEIKTDDTSNPIWLKIAYLNNNIGYVSKKYVNILTTSDGEYFQVYKTNTPYLNFRAEPSTKADIISILREGTHVILLDEQINQDLRYKKWYKVRYNGKIGWVAAKYLDPQEWVLTATAYTSSPSSGTNRNSNMSLAGSTLTGTIVLPGETFSWLGTLESCSAVKGYLVAPIYVNGVRSEGAGGGVCQVSTTFNMAVKKVGIATNVHEHSLPVAYASRKDEASVSYPDWDFSFTNTLETPILIEFVPNRGTVKCNIYTTE